MKASQTDTDKPTIRIRPLSKRQLELNRHELRSRLIELNGEPSKQKDELVQEILDVFRNPDRWPIRDEQRIEILRYLYRCAETIRRTETA